MHTHAAACTTFSSLDRPLVPVSHEATYFAPWGVPVFRDTSDLVLTDELGDAVAATLGHALGGFLIGHGIVTVGSDLVEAVMAARLLDAACSKQLAAMSAGGPRVWTSTEEALVKRSHAYPRPLLEQGWDYLVRSALRDSGDPSHGSAVGTHRTCREVGL